MTEYDLFILKYLVFKKTLKDFTKVLISKYTSLKINEGVPVIDIEANEFNFN